MPMRNKVQQFLDSRSITPYKFRKDTGIAQRTAYDLYNCPDHVPSPAVLERICKTYRIQPNDVLEWVPDEEDANTSIPD